MPSMGSSGMQGVYPPPPKPLGIRIRHESMRNCTIVISIPKKKYQVPYACPTCNTTHRNKAVHLNLDGEGSVIISEGVLKDLQVAGMPGLTITNEVAKPPSQTISLGYKAPEVFQVERKKMHGGKLTVVKKNLLRPDGTVLRNNKEN